MLEIIIPWRDREELSQSAPSFVATAKRCGTRLSVVNFGGDPSQLRFLLGEHAPAFHCTDVDGETYFNKARCNNIGAAFATGDLLFFCDCDIILNESVDPLFAAVASREGVFGTVEGVRETMPNARAANNLVCFGYTLFLKIRNGRTLTIVDTEEDADDGSRQAPGLLVVKRQDFDAVKGYNGDFVGWGWEDQDMIARLTLGRGLKRLQGGVVEHISHDDAARTRHHPTTYANRWESRDRMFRQALQNYDEDNFSGTFDRDNALAAGITEP